MGEIAEKLAEWLFHEKAGFAWVLFFLVVLCGALGAEGLRGALLAILLGLLFFWPGDWLDRHVFDRLYGAREGVAGPRPDAQATGDDLRLTIEHAALGAEAFQASAKVERKARAGSPPRLARSLPGRKSLDAAREKAAEPFQIYHLEHGGLYRSCATLVRPTSVWAKQIDPLLQASKTARAFILPLLTIAMVDMVWPYWLKRLQGLPAAEHPLAGSPPLYEVVNAQAADWTQRAIVAAFGTWWLMLGLSAVMLVLYLACRIQHMLVLCRHAAGARWIRVSFVDDRDEAAPFTLRR